MRQRRGRAKLTKVAGRPRSKPDTVHLLGSPANARRLLAALSRARRGEVPPQSLQQLRREVGLEPSE